MAADLAADLVTDVTDVTDVKVIFALLLFIMNISGKVTLRSRKGLVGTATVEGIVKLGALLQPVN